MDAGNETGFWSNIQWGATTIIGLFTFFYGLWMKYVYEEIKGLKAKQEIMEKDAADIVSKGDDQLWDALESIRTKLDQVVARDELLRLQTAIDEDRKQSAHDRANIAVMMATKTELERQLDKLYNRLMDQLQK